MKTPLHRLFSITLLPMLLFIAGQPQAPAAETKQALATFAGGCFWCMEPPFDKLDGVISTTSGYSGGRVDRPSYEQVSAGGEL